MSMYQRFFDFLSDEHGLILLESEMDAIVQEALLFARNNRVHQLLKEDENDSIHRVSFDPVDSIPLSEAV